MGFDDSVYLFVERDYVNGGVNPAEVLGEVVFSWESWIESARSA
jgi:hypothetical protein